MTREQLLDELRRRRREPAYAEFKARLEKAMIEHKPTLDRLAAGPPSRSSS